MKKFTLILTLIFLCVLIAACTDEDDFSKAKKQLEAQGYTNVENTGYAAFCCSEEDMYRTGFAAKDKSGNTVKGCICSGPLKGITIRYE